jgi:hypothetical protein
MFMVSGVPLIPQSKQWACWYASAQMLIQWKRERELATLADHPDPSQVDDLVKLRELDKGLSYTGVLLLAQQLGLRPIAPMSLSLRGVESCLQQYGPLWTHGAAHVVVIAGVDKPRDQVFVHDPSPVNRGAKEWRSYTNWFIRGRSNARRATENNLASFLYHP